MYPDRRPDSINVPYSHKTAMSIPEVCLNPPGSNPRTISSDK